MAQANKNTATATAGKATAPAPVATATATAPAPAAPVATATAAPVAVAIGAALYTYMPYSAAASAGWPVGQRGHRAFACQVAQALAKVQPNGFTLAQYRAALVASAAASPTLAPPNGGWQRHNMPQWAAAQAWLVPVATAAAAAAAPVATAAAPAPAPAKA
jgi:hypothetical protein